MSRLALRIFMLPLVLAGCPAKDGEGTETGTTPSPTDGTPTDTDTTIPTTPTSLSEYANADLSDPAAVTLLALGSAPQVYFVPFLGAFSAVDPKCPVVTVDGDTTTLTGGCIDSNGTEWFGVLDYTVSKITKVGTIDFAAYGSTGEVSCTGTGTVTNHVRWTGTATYRADGTFDVFLASDITALDLDACSAEAATADIVYTGSTTPQGSGDIWNGSGRYANSTVGKVDVQTIAEVIDSSVCNSEAASGTTILTTSTQQVNLIYDGSFDCDPESTVGWQLDGVDQGELIGIACSSTGMPPGAPLLAACLLGLRRRRGLRAR